MYNRYIRNDQGNYTRVPQQDLHGQPPPPKTTSRKAPLLPPDSLTALLRHGLDRLHLDHVDTGDLLLLGLLFFLFREDADEELLVALGLLLIL